jgi:CRP-like cAMP-binding protein
VVTKDFLRATPPFSALAEGDAAALAAMARPETFKKGEAVFREGDPADRLYVVLSGVVELSRLASGRTRPQTLGRLERGEVLGEAGLFDPALRSATATAALVPETRLGTWSCAEVRKFLDERPAAKAALAEAVVRRMGERLRRTSEAVHALLRALE